MKFVPSKSNPALKQTVPSVKVAVPRRAVIPAKITPKIPKLRPGIRVQGRPAINLGQSRRFTEVDPTAKPEQTSSASTTSESTSSTKSYDASPGQSQSTTGSDVLPPERPSVQPEVVAPPISQPGTNDLFSTRNILIAGAGVVILGGLVWWLKQKK